METSWGRRAGGDGLGETGWGRRAGGDKRAGVTRVGGNKRANSHSCRHLVFLHADTVLVPKSVVAPKEPNSCAADQLSKSTAL